MRAALWMLVGLLAGGLLALAAADANAYGTVPKGAGGTGTGYNSTVDAPSNCQGLSSVDALGLCVFNLRKKAEFQSNYGGTFTYQGPQPNTCATLVANGSGTCGYYACKAGDCSWGFAVQAFTSTISTGGTCPANSATDAYTGDTSVCRCNQGYQPDQYGTACQTYNCAKASGTVPASMLDAQVYEVGTTAKMCIDGCSATPAKVWTASDGRKWASGPFAWDGVTDIPGQTVTGNGQTCEDYAAADPKAADTAASGPQKNVSGPARDGDNGAPSTCGAGLCPGTVNGASVCVACSKSEITGPAVSASGATTGDAAAPSGTTSTKTTTTCTNNSCTTVTNYYGSNGALLGQKTETKPGTVGDGSGSGGGGSSFCAENPTSPICKNSTFSGACGGTFTCDGDAIQCAIAKDQLKRNCTVFDDSTAVSAIGNAAYAAGVAGGASHPKASPTVVDLSGGFDQTNLLSGSCPTAITIPATGMFPSMSMNLGPLCTAAGWLGNLLVGLTALACVAIVFVRGS